MSHITQEQRYTIELLLNENFKINYIANIIGVHRSTVYREIQRNSDLRNNEYRSCLAQKKYENRLKNKVRYTKITPELWIKIKSLLQNDYSPEQITGYLNKNGLTSMSHEWIYQQIWLDKKRNGELHKHLRNKGRRYKKRGQQKDNRGVIANRVNISKRPIEATQRTSFGHLEVDTIIGKNHKGAIVTINDLASGAFWMRKVESKDANLVKQAIESILREIKPYIKSITADNGKEFALHQEINDHYCDFYFADPYSPWQRGANENINRLVRQYIPKKTDFSTITNDFIKTIQDKINNRPRKRFNYETPIFVMEKLLFNNLSRL